MSCPTCAFNLRYIGNGWSWCGQCGTMKNDKGHHLAPLLIARLRRHEDKGNPLAQQLGINLTPPEETP